MMKKLLIFISFLSLTMMPSNAIAQEILRSITVTGQGVERIPATIAQVRLGVEMEGKNAGEVQQKVAQSTNSLVELLRAKNVQRLQTTGIQLRPNYDYTNNRRNLVGYVATNIVSFEFPVDQVGSLLDDSVRVGATRIDNVSLTASDSAIAQAQQQALVKATQDAQQQAETVLNALNLSAKEIVTISINGANTPQPMPRAVMMDAMASRESSTPVVGGEQGVNASVTLQIRY